MLSHGSSVPLYYQLFPWVPKFLDPSQQTQFVTVLAAVEDEHSCHFPFPFSHLTQSKQQVTSILPPATPQWGNSGLTVSSFSCHALLPTAQVMQLSLLRTLWPTNAFRDCNILLVHQLLVGGHLLSGRPYLLQRENYHLMVSLTLGSVVCLIIYSWGPLTVPPRLAFDFLLHGVSQGFFLRRYRHIYSL